MDDLTIETFLSEVTSDFRLADPASGEPVTLRLVEVVSAGRQPTAPRVEPFSLIFVGPPVPVLEQRIHRLEHGTLGSLDIFLVPIGYDATGSMRYEAVFN